MRALLAVVERDFRYFLRYRWWIAGMVSMNLADLFIMALVYARMTNPDVVVDYFVFFAPGLTVTAAFAAAFMIGREVNMELRREVTHYMLSLPIERWKLAAGRVISGGIRGVAYVAPLLATTLAITNAYTGRLPTPPELLTVLAVLSSLCLGTSGLSIALALSTKSFEKYVTARSVVYYALFFCSTVFYPLSLVERVFPPLAIPARLNPVSCGADLSRALLLGWAEPTPFMLVDVLLYALVFGLLAASSYARTTRK
ncbi:MAG: ABC transporter permease [Candidatus Nezhaarchaeota archaeon]|nr:ABC transporter permease [Candidatus Nezhaarchaeota archaeon]